MYDLIHFILEFDLTRYKIVEMRFEFKLMLWSII